MHNNIMAAGSKDRPPMLGPGRYSQWRSRFLRYLDTKSNGEYLRKCIFEVIPEQARKDKDMKELGTPCLMYFGEAVQNYQQQPSNFLNSRNKTEDTHQGITTLISQGSLGFKGRDGQLLGLGNCRRKPKRRKRYDEMIEQELEAHYSYMAKIQEVLLEESSSTSQPPEKVQNHDENNVFANVRGNSEQPESINDTYVLEKILYDTSDPANRFCPNGEETVTLEKESRSKLDKDKVKPYDYTYQNSLYETFNTHQNLPYQLERAKEVGRQCGRKTFVRDKPNIAKSGLSYPFLNPLVKEMHDDLEYVKSLENEVDELESEKADFSNMYDPLLEEFTQQNLPQNRKQAEIHSNVLKPGMYRIATTTTQNREPQLPYALRNTNPYVSKSTGVNHYTSVSKPQLKSYQVKDKIVQLILFIVDSGCTKHMTDLNQRNVTIKLFYYVEGLNHNLFSVGQFCDADLEVAFRKSTCFVRDLQGNDLLTGNRGSDLYTISLQETTSSTPICFMAKASPTQAWLWHRRLSHLNFDYITLLSKKDVVTGLPKLKYVKDQLCSSCEMSKAKRSSFKSKVVPSSKGRLNLLHMDLCGPMRVASINGKKYILVIVDDYSRYTWTLFLRSKDETPEVLKDFLTMIQRNLQAQVITVRTDRGTEFLNKTLHAYFKEEGIEHQTSTPRTPEQNGVVERRNRTLVEAARTMLSASKLPLSFWAEAVATACYTQNRSIIISTHGKTAYHIINDRKPSIKHLHIFGCICYITRDGENLDKMKEKGDPCVMVGYSTQSKGYRVYNKRTRLIVESIHIKFDEIKEMMSDHNSSDLAPQRQEMSVENVSSGLVPQGQKASDYDNSDPVPPRQNVVP
ncbi:retrovirus-related pol polyprotein from transposon TNT 1-94 [Tanacetum coccineum]|uniref:Retrovirus-related pol polyprotein from transposon TNT 1-94 n=1 Tax=Tanacetum coccineum TaxID=301880 RepID=A0ABQ4XRP3_9ASTR